MRKAFPVALALIALVVAATALAAPRDAFWGTWKVTVTPDDDARSAGAKELKDTFTFKGDQFESAALKKHGFEPAQYTEDTRAAIAATFKCEAKSKSEGTATWTGTSTGTDINGEMTWKKADGTELHYTFKGTRESR